MDQQKFDDDAIVLQTRIPEDRDLRGVTYGAVCKRFNATYRYLRLNSGPWKNRWIVAAEAPDCGADRDVMREIRNELGTLRIVPREYGTASEVSQAVGSPRTTLITAASRGEIEHCHTAGGTLLIEIAAAKRWAKQTRKVGPKFKSDKTG